jgi:hypothetical protein
LNKAGRSRNRGHARCPHTLVAQLTRKVQLNLMISHRVGPSKPHGRVERCRRQRRQPHRRPARFEYQLRSPACIAPPTSWTRTTPLCLVRRIRGRIQRRRCEGRKRRHVDKAVDTRGGAPGSRGEATLVFPGHMPALLAPDPAAFAPACWRAVAERRWLRGRFRN